MIWGHWGLFCLIFPIREAEKHWSQFVTSQLSHSQIMETWTNALGVKMQFAEVYPKLIAQAETAKLEYQASLELLNETVRSMIF